eukprot:5457995-Prymnesium_polylepis.1
MDGDAGRALEAALTALRSHQSEATLNSLIRRLGEALGNSRLEASSERAILACLDQLEHPEEFQRDQDVWEKHGVSRSSFKSWKRRIRPLLTEAAVSVADAAVIEALAVEDGLAQPQQSSEPSSGDGSEDHALDPESFVMAELIDFAAPVRDTASDCWGCGRPEGGCGAALRFKSCERCVEHKLIPAKFCSEDCFKAAWPRHKAWHNEQQSYIVGDCVEELEERLVEKLEELRAKSSYGALIADAHPLILGHKWKKAAKLLERATRLDPNRPEAYFDLAACYHASNNMVKELEMQERATQLWALVATTGVIGNKMIEGEDHPRWAADQWATCVILTGNHYVSKRLNDHPKPFWFKNDSLLKLTLREAQKARVATGEELSGKLMLLQAFAFSGIMRDGVFQTETHLDRSTSKELALASQSYMKAVELLSDELSEDEKRRYRSHAQICGDFSISAAMQGLDLGDGENEPIVGTWVLVKGLESATGARLNDNVGCIIGCKNTNGRLPVEVIDDQGSRTHALIKATNLYEYPLKDQGLALLASMEERERWSWVKSTLGRHRENFCIPLSARKRSTVPQAARKAAANGGGSRLDIAPPLAVVRAEAAPEPAAVPAAEEELRAVL